MVRGTVLRRGARRSTRARRLGLPGLRRSARRARRPARRSSSTRSYTAGTSSRPRAGFYGLAGWHTRADVLRALYEGVVYGHLSQIENLLAAGARVDSARLIGGGALRCARPPAGARSPPRSGRRPGWGMAGP